jgi:hypothetical protein
MNYPKVSRFNVLSWSLFLAVAIPWYAAGAANAWRLGLGADVMRQWIVCRYVLAGQNPYGISREAFEAEFGPVASLRKKVYSAPRHIPVSLTASILPQYGIPEAAYPPGSIGLLCLGFGFIPNPQVALALWLAMLAVSLWLSIKQIEGLLRSLSGQKDVRRPLLIGLLVLLFPPFYLSIAVAQFTLPVLVCLLYAFRRRTSDLAAGVCLSIAMLKPSIALPFLAIPLFRRRWKPLLLLAAAQLAGIAFVCVSVQASPMIMLKDWLVVSRYYLHGMYTVQEFINSFQLQAYAGVISGSVLIAGVIVLWRASAARMEYQIAFAGALSLFWTYHGPYDFLFAMPALLLLMRWRGEDAMEGRNEEAKWIYITLGATGLLVLALALAPPVYEGDTFVQRILRWAARIMVPSILLASGGMLLEAAENKGARDQTTPEA